jgi:AcrR family transcriptional regulator
MDELKIDTALDAPAVGARAERRDAAEHRRLILETARTLFAERGIDAVSMHQIALAAGVGQGTLYRRFAHKGELCSELMSDGWQTLQERIVEIAADEAQPPMDRLDGVLTAIVHSINANVPFFKAMHAAGLAIPKDRKDKKSDPYYQWMQQTIAGLCGQCVEAGEMPPLDPAFIADTLLGALQNLYERHSEDYTAEQILDGVRRLFLARR